MFAFGEDSEHLTVLVNEQKGYRELAYEHDMKPYKHRIMLLCPCPACVERRRPVGNKG